MKAEMDANGVITLAPESSVEAFALRHWYQEAELEHKPSDGGAAHSAIHCRMLIVKTECE